jgi:hypothetical protein
MRAIQLPRLNSLKPSKMKTKILILIMLTSIGSASLYGQATTTGNFSINPPDYLGWDNATNFDLNIRHAGNYNMIFSTNNLERARISSDGRLFVGTTTGPNGRIVVEATGTIDVGVRGRAAGANTLNVGGWFTGNAGTIGTGAYGLATSSSATRNYGVYGEACNAENNYAVYGVACVSDANNWAGYFVGKTFCTSGVWDASDSGLKTNVSNLSSATAMLMAMNPKSYEFVTDYPQLNLPAGLQFGLIAQELEEVIPHAVTQVNAPPQFDAEGNETAPGVDFKGVNYTQLIPVLIAGSNEQDAAIEMNKSKRAELTARLESVQSKLDALKNSGANATGAIMHQNHASKKAILENTFPNPFENEIQLPFRVNEDGLVRIDIVDSKGALVVTLKNEVIPVGAYNTVWNAYGMSAGVYYCVIRHGSEVHAQRMVKQ